MDRGKRPGKMFGVRNNKIYMDLKDIIRENALPYLPAKSLFRFRSVCRDWKLQISTPFFAHNQSLSCRAVSGFFCQAPGEPPTLISVDPTVCGVPDPMLTFLPEPVDKLDIRSSSNGLLCVQGQAGDRAYYVCNPLTQQFKKLPKPNADHGRHPAVVLIFEPSLLNFEAEYKIICAFASNDFDDATEFEIYSSREGSWKVSGEICFTNISIDPKSGVYADGIVFWKGRGILAYDLTKERSQLFHHYGSHVGTMGTLNGKLYASAFNGRSLCLSVLGNLHFNTMPTYSSHLWKEDKRITLDKDMISGTGSDQTVVAMSGNVVLVKSGGKLYSYDVKTKKLTALDVTVKYGHNAVYLPYVNSFASL